MFDFAPLKIRQNSRKTDNITRYRIEVVGGPDVIVEAASAAEAMKKSGVREARRIVNLDIERLHFLASGLLQPEDAHSSTSISMDESELPQFFKAEIPEQNNEEVPFEEMTLDVMAEQAASLGGVRGPMPATVPTQPQPIENTPVVPVMEAEVGDDAKAEIYEIEAAPMPPSMMPEPDMRSEESPKQLTPEEVRNLLKTEVPPE